MNTATGAEHDCDPQGYPTDDLPASSVLLVTLLNSFSNSYIVCVQEVSPFLRGMEHYSKVVEMLCNGTPYLAWIWAPVRLILTI